MKATAKTFKAMYAKAVEMGYPQDLIGLTKSEIRFCYQNENGDYKVLDMIERARDVVSVINEFFCDYDLTVSECRNIVIEKGLPSGRGLEGFADPMHY
jgi:hypothetical protein